MSDTRERYHELQKYSKYLKSGLKCHQGTKLDKDGKIYKKFKIYQNLKKLMEKWKIDSHDENVILKVNSYYELLRGKIIKMKKCLDNEKNKPETQMVEDNIKDRLEGSAEELQQENEVEVDEIGPTPQLNGRVLGLFDIQTSPIKSPTKPLNLGSDVNSLDGCKLNLGILLNDNNSKIDDPIFKTPTTKRVIDLKINETPGYLHSVTQRMSSVDEVLGLNDWSDISEGDVSEDEADYGNGKDKKIGGELRKDKNVEEPYDNWNNASEEEGIEPSPLIKRCSKSLFDMHNELGSLKKNLRDLMQEEMIGVNHAENDDYVEMTIGVEKRQVNTSRLNSEVSKKNDQNDDDGDKIEEIKQENDTINDHKREEEIEQQFKEEENELDIKKLKEVNDPHAHLRNKVKTIKRSTKRSRLKTTKIGPIHDEYEDINLHEIIKKSRNEDDDTDEDNDDAKNNEYEEEYGGDIAQEEIYVRKDFSDLLSKQGKGKGKHPLSNNFVRLKINNKRKRRR